MKLRKDVRALSLLMVIALFGAIFVPAVSADVDNFIENPSCVGDVVDINVTSERSSFIFDDKGNRMSDEKISQMIEKMPTVTYLDGMDIKKSEKIAERLSQLHKHRSLGKKECVDAFLMIQHEQADSGIRINNYHYNGINGNNHPGNMEVSSGGTAYQYLTSHIGQDIGGIPTWIEVCVTKQSPAVGGNPSEFVVFTFDSTMPEDEKYIAHQNFTSGTRNYNFEIYISSSQTSEGYPYMISWQGTVIRTGHLPFCYGDLDENHEYFALNGNLFTPVSESYFCDSYVYSCYNCNSLWWNENLPDSTVPHLTSCSAGAPELLNNVPWWSQAYQVKSWIA